MKAEYTTTTKKDLSGMPKSSVKRLSRDQFFQQIWSEPEKWFRSFKNDYRQGLETEILHFCQCFFRCMDIFCYVADIVIVQEFLGEVALHTIRLCVDDDIFI